MDTLFGSLYTKFMNAVNLSGKINKYELTNEQKEIANQLINDGWYGTVDELLDCARRLSK